MALSRHHRIPEDKQVLLTHDGRLLEHQQMIGAYGVGTVSVAHSIMYVYCSQNVTLVKFCLLLFVEV